ncbi:MAG: hypothetical protein JNK75_08250 [Betaproteobacteria bacterium]|nr:hypothetical protein [Betaproteobacteria bacterium]
MNRPPVRIPPKQKLSVWGTPWPLEPEFLRVRLKYVTARFLQMPEPRMALRNTTEILTFAQQLIDDGHPRAATELTRLAIEEDSAQRPLWLFLLGRLYLADNAPDYLETAALFAKQFPGDAAIGEIDTLGQWLAAPGHPSIDPARVHDWRAAALLGRDSSVQADFHALLARIALSPPLR